jgi:hypothetical protein
MPTYPSVSHGTPAHSHSIISGYRNTLNFNRKLFVQTDKIRRVVRQIFSLLISKGNLPCSDFRRFQRLSTGDRIFFVTPAIGSRRDGFEKDRQQA